MKEKRKTKLLAIGLTLTISVLIPFGNVKAALQANPNTQYTKGDTPENWISNMRKMEENGSTMGLSEKLNSDLTASSDSNNIDVHMMKSTEYGAIAILSASGYGNSQTLQDSSVKTTTGNKTGVYFDGTSWEWVAGGYQGIVFTNVNSRYYDTYFGNKASAKIGDALGDATATNPGCAGWHFSKSSWVSANYSGMIRNINGLFGFGCGLMTHSTHARGVAVVGTGI